MINFINIGPGRCATSWLYAALLEHPEVVTSKSKETNFFNCNYNKGVDYYISLFPSQGKIFGEISNLYFSNPNVAARIYDFNPDTKIIINLREPFSLALSTKVFGLRRAMNLTGKTIFDISYADIMGDGKKCDSPLSMAEALNYLHVVENYVSIFGKNNIYFLIYERIGKEPELVVKELYEFLGVNSNFSPKSLHTVINPSASPRNQYLARLSRVASRFLRKLGFLSLIDKLKRSSFIRCMIFKDSFNPALSAVALGAVLNQDERDFLLESKSLFLEKIPELNRWWIDE